MALAVAVWVQSQLMAWDFGLLDGRGINWTAWTYHAYLEILIWAVILSVVCYLAFRKEKLFQAVTQGIILLGALTLVSSWVTSDYKSKQDTGRDVETPFLFHPENNKIVIVLDAFQSDIFGEIARRWPKEVSFLRGFTYYPNTLGGFSSTAAACPLILTGEFYKNEIPILDWIEKNNSKLNIADYFAFKGYNVTLVSFIGKTLYGIKAPQFNLNSLGEARLNSRLRSTLLVLDGGMFRALPIVLKKSFYDRGNWFLTKLTVTPKVLPLWHGDDLRFVQAFETKAAVGSDKDSAFRYYHLVGAHPPIEVNANYEYIGGVPDTRESYIQQSRGVLGLLRRMLQRLEDIKIYETAEIIVTGDHGHKLHRPDDLFKNNDIKEVPGDDVLALSRPVFLYKPPDSKASLTYSDAPMHLEDVVCILSGNAFPNCGEHLSLLGKSNQRKRTFFYYDYSLSYWDGVKKYMPPMTKYIVEGDARDLSAWNNTYIEYSWGTSRRLPKNQSYSLNDIIDFSETGVSSSYIQQGWSGQESTHRWTEGPRAVIKMELKETPRNDLTFRLYGEAFPSRGKEPQSVGVVVNDKKVVEWQMLDLAWYEATIPEDLVADRLLNVVFEIGNPTAPCTVSSSTDCRQLGVAFRKLVITEKKVVH